MLTIDQAARDYGITVDCVEGAEYTVKGFVLTPLSTACVLWFRIIEPGGKGIPGRHVRVTNGGDKLTFPSKEDGRCDMAVGKDSQYLPAALFPLDAESGPHSAEVFEAPSDKVHGLGWFSGTDHQSLITIWQAEGEGTMSDYELVDFGPLNLYTHFREAGVTVHNDAKYGVTHLIAKGGSKDDKPFPLEVTVRKRNGDPAVGVVLKLKRHGGQGGAWDHVTDADGRIVIPMDDGDWRYAVPSMPAYSVQLGKGMGGSDVVRVGWVKGQRRWFNVVFQARGGGGDLPGKPVLSDLDAGATQFYVRIVSEGADTRHYTLDGPDYHKDGEAGESALYVSGLQPATDYSLKVWGRNSAGDSPDAELTFTTLEEEPDPDPPDDCEELINAVIARLEDLIEWLEAQRDGG